MIVDKQKLSFPKKDRSNSDVPPPLVGIIFLKLLFYLEVEDDKPNATFFSGTQLFLTIGSVLRPGLIIRHASVIYESPAVPNDFNAWIEPHRVFFWLQNGVAFLIFGKGFEAMLHLKSSVQ